MINVNSKELPKGWCWVKLGDICAQIETKNPNIDPESEFEYIDIASIDNTIKKIIFPKRYLGKNAPSRARQLVRKNDIVFSTVRTYLMNIALVPDSLDGQIASTGFCVIRAKKELNQKFVFYYSLSHQFVEPLNELQRGTSYPAIRDSDVFGQPFPLCATAEQYRIVEKIEELFSDLDKGIESLKTTQQQLKIYRQAVLKWAFEGKLTAKWREDKKQQGELKSADELLEQIKAEREKRDRTQLQEWHEAVKTWEANGKQGKKPGKPKKAKELPSLTENEIAELTKLPETWFWTKLGEMTLGVEYGTSAKSKKQGKVIVLRMGNIQRFIFDWSDLVYSDDDEEIEKYLLRKGDILFNRTNSPELVGKSAIYQGEKSAIFAGYLIRINQINELANSKYLNYFLNSTIAKNYGNKVKTDGVNQSNINGEKLISYPLPYCSLEEQHQIVQEIEFRLSICDRLEATITENLTRAEALRQSILKQAFEGKLVPQDPNDEPAEKLLERIKQEKLDSKNGKQLELEIFETS